MTPISIPEFCLVALIGASGSGKTTFARRHFGAGEVLSSDHFRLLVSGDENAQDATRDAFEALYFVARQRLRRGLLTVIDATSVQADSRKAILALAKEFDVLPVALVLNLPDDVLRSRHQARPDRPFPLSVVAQQANLLHRSLPTLQKEGFRHVTVLHTPQEVEAAHITRTRLYSNLRHEHGPFDFIGDVHGCSAELRALLSRLGYTLDGDTVTPPPGRKAVFLGDLVDRGPDTPGVLRLVMGMVAAGSALCVPGNHDEKLGRALMGERVKVAHGLAESLEQLGHEPPEFRQAAASFLRSLVSHYVLDGDEQGRGRVVAAHAGMKEAYQGRASGRVRAFALYGETSGESDEFGLPVRLDWAAGYRGQAYVIYGHTPVVQPEWLNRTLDIDTGCVFGGALTALRYPELELVSVPAAQVYCPPVRPLGWVPGLQDLNAQQTHDELLDLADVVGKRVVETRLRGRVTVHEDEAAAALETVSRFATDPRWLLYLPPTMSPCETSRQDGYLEAPAEAFGHYRRAGVQHVICEEKHMGSRAVLIVTRQGDVAAERFGVPGGAAGVVYTRTGRRFFEDAEMEHACLQQTRAALDAAGVWDHLNTDWVLLDAEILPWSLKAGPLIRGQYAAVGAAAQADLSAGAAVLEAGVSRGLPLGELPARTRERQAMTQGYTAAYRQYVRRVHSLADVRVAPFHLLASEGAVHAEQPHAWHLDLTDRLAQAAPGLYVATERRAVDLHDPDSCQDAEAWWAALTAAGGEGMVVKPASFVARGPRGLLQPGLKVRGREYLRLIYGPEYTLPEHLERLRARGLSGKRALALKEFALGVEGLERFVRREPLRRVHECAVAVLALESEGVDPRL